MKKFYLDLRKHATEIINCEKKEIIRLREKLEKKCKKQKFCEISNKTNKQKSDDKNNEKFKIAVITQENVGALLMITVTYDTKQNKIFFWSFILILNMKESL